MPDVWDPWLELERREHIVFALDPIAELGGGAIYARRGAVAAIVIDPALTARERRAALAHELVHDERDGIADDPAAPPTWSAVIAREERTVERVVAARLVPLDALRRWARRDVSLDPVLVRDVADAFDVPDHLAETAVHLLGEDAGPAST